MRDFNGNMVCIMRFLFKYCIMKGSVIIALIIDFMIIVTVIVQFDMAKNLRQNLFCSELKLEHNQLAAFITMLRYILKEKPVNRDVFVSNYCAATLGMLMQKVCCVLFCGLNISSRTWKLSDAV